LTRVLRHILPPLNQFVGRNIRIRSHGNFPRWRFGMVEPRRAASADALPGRITGCVC
jgi:hypothetical protein